MESVARYFLSTLIVLPALGAGGFAIFSKRRWSRWIGLTATVLTFALSLSMLATYDWHTANGLTPVYACRDSAHPAGVVQFVQRVDLIRAWHVQYFLGVDGLSLPLVLLTGFIFVRVCVALWGRNASASSSLPAFLLLESCLLGLFLSLNLVLFFAFFAISILPVLYLFKVNTGGGSRCSFVQFAATMSISILCLFLAMIAMHRIVAAWDMVALPALLQRQVALGGKSAIAGKLCFLLLMMTFALRLPVAPLHRWFFHICSQIAAPLGMVLPVMLVATGGYGILRIAYPFFPRAGGSYWMLVSVLGVGNIFYGGLAAFAGKTLRQIVACISIYQVGFILLGSAMLSQQATTGAAFMLLSHGLTIALLMALAGVVIERFGHDDLQQFQSPQTHAPVLAGFLAIGVIAAVGVPFFCGFVGEMLVILGSFAAANSESTLRVTGAGTPVGIYAMAIFASFSPALLSAGVLWRLRTFLLAGGREMPTAQFDLRQRDVTLLSPILAAVVLLGVLPMPLYFAFTRTTIEAIWNIEKLL